LEVALYFEKFLNMYLFYFFVKLKLEHMFV